MAFHVGTKIVYCQLLLRLVLACLLPTVTLLPEASCAHFAAHLLVWAAFTAYHALIVPQVSPVLVTSC
jgi:hypothetical protein